MLLVSEYSRNLPFLSGSCKTGGFCNLLFISSKAVCCSLPKQNVYLFLSNHVWVLAISEVPGKGYLHNLPFPQNFYSLLLLWEVLAFERLPVYFSKVSHTPFSPLQIWYCPYTVILS